VIFEVGDQETPFGGFFASQPDLEIPRTDYMLPLTCEHLKAIRRLVRFYAMLYEQARQAADKAASLGKYERWTATLFQQMEASIRDGMVLCMSRC